MGQEAKIKEVVRRWRKGEITVDMDNLEKFVSGLRERTLSRTLARSAGMQTKYTEQSEGKFPEGLSRGYVRALKRARKNSPESVERVKKTYPGPRVSNGLTRRASYE